MNSQQNMHYFEGVGSNFDRNAMPKDLSQTAVECLAKVRNVLLHLFTFYPKRDDDPRYSNFHVSQSGSTTNQMILAFHS